MKSILTFTILSISSICLYGQSFEYSPSTQKARFQGTTGDAAIEFLIREYQGSYQHAQLTVRDEESHPFIDFTYDDGGKIILNKFEGIYASELSKKTLSFVNKGDTKYKLDTDTGFEVFDDNGNVDYKITVGNGFQAYDASGNVSVQIRGNVGGDGRVSTNELEITGGSDFSENFDIVAHKSVSIQPGMLVSIEGESGKLALSSTKRDKKVVGIISGANGIETGMIMGQKGSIADGDYPIALSGRTYVYANTENGPIRPGDFITTSSTPGYGMKVKKHKKAQGSIVGKAMTSLKEGSGYVLVLVNLQ